MSSGHVMSVSIISVLMIILAAFLGWGIIDDPDVPLSPDIPSVPEGPEEYPFDNDIPDGFTLDLKDNILSTDGEVTWHVFDMYHTFMQDRYSEYSGVDITSDHLDLSPGGYVITIGDEEFEVRIAGDVERTFSWKYRSDDSTQTVSVAISIPMEDFMEACDSNRAWNESMITTHTYMPFASLPELVVVDDTIRALESALEGEFVRVGGDLDDRQGFADFMASFVQLAVKYPSSVSGRSFDYYVWGSDEYWCVPLETLYHGIGDCEDTSALLCALYIAAGFEAAMGGHSGHVFAGVVIDDFQERVLVDYSYYKLSYAYGITGFIGKDPVFGDTLYRSVETIRGQLPVGYLAGGNGNLDKMTFWGYAGFYPVSG
ncbi:MAG: hypothetical protein ACI38Y_01910 [Candidatus Methanomethylophilaceae archaeon]